MSCNLIVWLLFLLAFAAQSLLCWRLGQAFNQGVYLRGKGNTSEIEPFARPIQDGAITDLYGKLRRVDGLFLAGACNQRKNLNHIAALWWSITYQLKRSLGSEKIDAAAVHVLAETQNYLRSNSRNSGSLCASVTISAQSVHYVVRAVVVVARQIISLVYEVHRGCSPLAWQSCG